MNKLSKGVLISAVIAFSSTFVSSAYADNNVYGPGAKSCGIWVADNDKKNGAGIHSNHVWLLGYISGAGYFSSSDIKKSDAYAMKAWMDNYCSNNPLSGVSDAANVLVRELSK